MSPLTAREVLVSLMKNPALGVEGIYTHLACADSAVATAQQLTLFNKTLSGFEKEANAFSTRPIQGRPWHAQRLGTMWFGRDWSCTAFTLGQA
jgi:alanine racemase